MFGWGESKEKLEAKAKAEAEGNAEREAATEIQRAFRGFKGRIATAKLQAKDVRKAHARELEVDKRKRRENVLLPKNAQMMLAVDEHRCMEIVYLLDTVLSADDYTQGDATVQVDPEKDVIDMRFREERLGETFLIRASRLGLFDVVQLLLRRKGVVVHDSDDFGVSALAAAAKGGYLHCCAALLERKDGSRIYARDHDQWTALLHASAEGHWPVVRYLLDNKGDVTAVTSFGDTCLHKAALAGHLEVIRLLAQDSDINLNAQNAQGFTALLLAAYYGHFDAVRYLASLQLVQPDLKNGVGQNVRNMLPSVVALRNYKGDRKMPRDRREALHALREEMERAMQLGLDDRVRGPPSSEWMSPEARAETYRRLTLDAVDRGQYDAAVKYAAMAHDQTPEDADLGRFVRRTRRARDLHAESFDKVLRVRRRAQAEIDYSTAVQHLKDGRYGDAIIWFANALDKDPHNEKYRSGRLTAVRKQREQEVNAKAEGERKKRGATGARASKREAAEAARRGQQRSCMTGIFCGR